MSTGVDFGHEPDYDAPEREPDDHEDELIATRLHTCGHTRSYWNCSLEGLPAESSPCPECQPPSPCPACGLGWACCACPEADPFEE